MSEIELRESSASESKMNIYLLITCLFLLSLRFLGQAITILDSFYVHKFVALSLCLPPSTRLCKINRLYVEMERISRWIVGGNNDKTFWKLEIISCDFNGSNYFSIQSNNEH